MILSKVHRPSIHGKEAKAPFDVPIILSRDDLAIINLLRQVHGQSVTYKSTCQI